MVNNGKPETGQTTKAYAAMTSFTPRPPFPRETDTGIHCRKTDGPPEPERKFRRGDKSIVPANQIVRKTVPMHAAKVYGGVDVQFH